jgi:hypothetical protein
MNQLNPAISLSGEKAVQADGVQSLARWSRVLEIIIPAYMLGKSWGIAEGKNIELFRMQFPSFLIDATEFLKDLMSVKSEYLMRFIATTSGAVIALAVIAYDARKPVNLTGSAAAGPIWANFIRDASAKLPEKDFTKPNDVVVMNICLDSGQVASELCPRQIDMAFVAGTEPEDIHTGNIEGLLNQLEKGITSGFER